MLALASLCATSCAVLAGAPQGGACEGLFVQEQKLVPVPLFSTDRFGKGLALDGDRAMIGAWGAGGVTGAAYYYFREDGVWTRKQRIQALNNKSNEYFALSIALAGDRALFAAPGHQSATLGGCVYWFALVGPNWIEQGKLVATPPNPYASFGTSVAVDGDTLAVGAWDDDEAGYRAGAGYAFVFDGSAWTQQAKLFSSDMALDAWMGDRVAISGDTIAVAAPNTGAGAVYVYVRSGTDWSEQAKLVASDGQADDFLGRDVALHGDVLVAGAPSADFVGTSSGAVYVFERSGSVWTETQKILACDATASQSFGRALAFDGERLAVGAPYHDGAGTNAGMVYVYSRVGGAFVLDGTLPASDGSEDDSYGVTVAVDGPRVFAGADRDDTPANAAGSAYAHELGVRPVVYCTAKTNSCGGAPAIAWSGFASAAASSGFTVGASGAREGKPGLLLYSASGRASAPFHGGLLCVDPGMGRRTVPVAASGGSPGTCDATFAIDMNAFAAGALGGNQPAWLSLPGQRIDAQWWGRDTPAQGPFLSDAVEYFVGA